MKSIINILLIDDHPLYRKALEPVIHALADVVNLFEAASLAQAMALIGNQTAFNLVLLDLTLPDSDGLQSLIPICQLLPDTPVVIISACENRQMIINALNAGARGYIPKSADSAIIENALALVLNGETYIPSAMLDGSSDLTLIEQGEVTALTGRQGEVLKLLAQGYSNKQIGRTLEIAETTVRVHVSDILQQLHVHNRTGAVIKAQQLGLLGPAAR
ncbi:MAG TPA: response regulator transcription factor [Gammaproteobacteria bacterium]|nr:response regulator transcription factor [Gammaproteobacteria bacterium]